MTAIGIAQSFWFNRFQVSGTPQKKLLFRDWLIPPARMVAAERFTGLAGRALEIAFFQHGFVPPVMSVVGTEVRDKPQAENDSLFWQFPCRTEGAAWAAHKHDLVPTLRDGAIHIYLGLPWATWIDMARNSAWGKAGFAKMAFQLHLIGTRLSGLRQALAELDVELRVHTVCQHIYWRDMVAAWCRLGVTDVWLSHCPAEELAISTLGLKVHPWSLYAVNVRDPERRRGIIEGRDPATKPILASFVGANGPDYLSDVRSRLRILADVPRFVVRLTEKWHFEDVVYSHQVGKAPLAGNYAIDQSVESYNQLLSDSVFSLCPAGTGPNSLRLWESLAVGTVPVLVGPASPMPEGGNLPPIDWERIIVRVADDQIAELPRILSKIPLEVVRNKQKLGMDAYALVRQQRCY